MAKKDNMILCANKETGKTKWLPASLFTDKDVASRLDFVPLEGKKFEDEPDNQSLQQLKEEREAKAKRMEFELNERKRLDAEAEAKALAEKEEVNTDPLGDNRHHSIIIKEIKASNDIVFVSKYLADSRTSVRESAEEKVKSLN